MLRLKLTPHTLHFRRPAPTSRGPMLARDLWVVRMMETQDPELVGLGECGPLAGLAADDRPGFGEEALRLVEDINRAGIRTGAQDGWIEWLDAILGPWDDELAALPSLRFGLESALLDLRTGGRGLYFDTPFTHGLVALPTHGLIWMDSPAGIEAQVEAKVASGFDVIKMKVGALPFDEDVALLHRLRTLHPQMTLRLDANGAFGPTDVGERLAALATLQVEFLEQPLKAGQRSALAALCAAPPLPIVLDEELIGLPNPEGLRNLLEEVRPQGIIIKPSLLGGWRAATRAAVLCNQIGVTWWANSLLESSLGHDAICQWTAALGGTRVHGLGTGSLFAHNFVSPIRLVGSALLRDVEIDRKNRGAIAH